MVKLSRVLVAVDFSPASDEAARYAVELARRMGAQVTLLHAYFIPVYPVGVAGAAIVPSAQTVASMAGDSVRALEALRARVAIPEVEVGVRSVEGPPTEVIVRVAADEGYDLIVMGTHGRTGLRRMLLGSVAEHVVRASPLPVLTLRAPEGADAHAQA